MLEIINILSIYEEFLKIIQKINNSSVKQSNQKKEHLGNKTMTQNLIYHHGYMK